MLIDDTEHAILCDFGLARVKNFIIASTRSMSSTTSHVGGSLNWLSPERLLGESPRGPADIYALGMTIFEVSKT